VSLTNGFILAAGLGTRFRPLTLTTPKPLIPVLGKPSIEYSLEIMQRLAVKEVVINTYHLADKLQERLGDGKKWGIDIRYSVETELLGTAGGFVKGFSLFSKPDTTVILSADVITNAEVERVIESHRLHQAEFTMGVLERDDVTGCGILQFDNEGQITRFTEKPTSDSEIFSHWINGSIYVAEPSVLKYLPPSGEFSDFSHDLFPTMVKAKAKLFAYPLAPGRDYLRGIDSPELLKRVETDIMNSKVFNEK